MNLQRSAAKKSFTFCFSKTHSDEKGDSGESGSDLMQLLPEKKMLLRGCFTGARILPVFTALGFAGRGPEKIKG
jgi:hypothetical protein